MPEPAAPRRSQWILPAAVVVGLVLAGVAMALILRSGQEPAARHPSRTPPETPVRTPESAGTIEYEDGRAIQLGTPRAAVERRLGEPASPRQGFPERSGGRPCVYYVIRSQPMTSYQYCFDGRNRVVSAAVAFPDTRR